MDPWPLHNLVLRTPRLELRPDDDAGLRELVAEARLGVHPPDYMPFTVPWTDNPEHEWLPSPGRRTPARGSASATRARATAPRCARRSRCSRSTTCAPRG